MIVTTTAIRPLRDASMIASIAAAVHTLEREGQFVRYGRSAVLCRDRFAVFGSVFQKLEFRQGGSLVERQLGKSLVQLAVRRGDDFPLVDQAQQADSAVSPAMLFREVDQCHVVSF